MTLYQWVHGITAENEAERYGITCQECDELALISYQRATKLQITAHLSGR